MDVAARSIDDGNADSFAPESIISPLPVKRTGKASM
jgi:hypothetical protein